MSKRIFISLIVLLVLSSVGVAFALVYQSPQIEVKNIDTFIETRQIASLPDVLFSPEPSPEATLIAVGDIMLSRNVAAKIKEYNDVDYPFLKVVDYLKSGDIVFGNLESPITPGPEVKTGSTTFHANPGVENGLKDSGFNILSLANNHFPDYGTKGIKDSLKYLDEAGIKHVGSGMNEVQAYAPAYLEINGLSFDFFTYNDTDVVPPSYGAASNHSGTAFMDIPKMTKAVKEAKIDSRFVIVSMHSGTEYTTKPNKRQITFARAAIDAGAEMVIGHHPHVVQEAEIYKGKYIFYSLGNFIFDQMWSQETREGLILKVKFNEFGVEKIEYQPILIDDYSQPRLLVGEEGEKIKKILKLNND